jgi:hypothetical protein
MALSKKKTRRHSCYGFTVEDAKRWWLRKGRGQAARKREARGATWRQVGAGSSHAPSYVIMERPKHKSDSIHDERRTTIMCDMGRLVAFEGDYRKGR